MLWFVQIDQQYDMVKIILLVYPVDVFLQGVLNLNQATLYSQYMNNLYKTAQQQQMDNVLLFNVTMTGIPTTDWCAFHPSSAADAAIATQLVAFISQTLPDWGSSTYAQIAQV